MCVLIAEVEMSEWISVKDRFPRLHQYVFVAALNEDDDIFYESAHFNPKNTFIAIGGDRLKRVQHWMQIPEISK